MGYGKLVSLEIVKIHQFVSLTTDNVIYQKKKKNGRKTNPFIHDKRRAYDWELKYAKKKMIRLIIEMVR